MKKYLAIAAAFASVVVFAPLSAQAGGGHIGLPDSVQSIRVNTLNSDTTERVYEARFNQHRGVRGHSFAKGHRKFRSHRSYNRAFRSHRGFFRGSVRHHKAHRLHHRKLRKF